MSNLTNLMQLVSSTYGVVVRIEISINTRKIAVDFLFIHSLLNPVNGLCVTVSHIFSILETMKFLHQVIMVIEPRHNVSRRPACHAAPTTRDSITMTLFPAFSKLYAMLSPEMPAPTTITSKLASFCSFGNVTFWSCCFHKVSRSPGTTVLSAASTTGHC